MYGFESSAESIILGAAFEAGQMRLGRREIFFTDLAIQRHEVAASCDVRCVYGAGTF
jgi:hypothetical protein